MSKIYLNFVFIVIFLLKFSSTIQLDGSCSQNQQCEGDTICQNGRCQCDAPWFRPCGTKCELRLNFVYEGEECRQDSNCIGNTRCDSSTKRCVCKDQLTNSNGLCYKKNNESCSSDDECWSRFCDISLRRCRCPDGYQTLNDGRRCQRKLSKLYENWSKANESNDFCIDENSCENIMAICKNDTIHREKFCQCPQLGYTLNVNQQRCEINLIDRLSPLNEAETNYNETCIYCKDNNAVCATIDRQSTCWCRAGFDKIGDECGSIRSKFIFPSLNDSVLFSSKLTCGNNNGSSTGAEGFCTCGNFYEFIDSTHQCKKIERHWISEYFEYGICTRITSNEDVQQTAETNGLCPPPLQCQTRGNKQICSCGLNRMLETRGNQSSCVFRLGKDVGGQNGQCPLYSSVVNQTCQCNPGYQQVDEDRRCEINLRPDIDLNGCDNVGSNDANNTCMNIYGGAARFCRAGECRCAPGISFANSDNTRCYGFLNISQPETYCPPNSQNDKSTKCECKREYRQTSDSRYCEPKSPLYEWNSSPVDHGIVQGDCENLYVGGLLPYNSSASVKACQCDQFSFRSPSGVQCWPLLYTNHTRDQTNCLMPNAERNMNNIKQCICSVGHRPTSSAKRDCERIRGQLYTDLNFPNDILPINDFDCRFLFGQLSISNNSRCVCRENVAFQSSDGLRCLALLSIDTGLSTLSNSSCPRDAIVQTQKCECLAGFIKAENNQRCSTIDIQLRGTKEKPSNKTCGNITDDNCVAKYGQGSICDNGACWCDRSLSFMTSDNLCESYSNFVFPGLHERSNYSCDVDEDCANENTNIDKVECTRIRSSDSFKVCVCKEGFYLNPSSQQCETRCPDDCANRPNSECRGQQCVCKSGFIEINSQCVENPNVLELYKSCNSSFTAKDNPSLTCANNCFRTQCASNFKDTGFQCVRLNFDSERCALQNGEFCSNLIRNSVCSLEENKCFCATGFYRDGNQCARPVDYRCRENEDCGSNTICIGQRCQCSDGQRVMDIHDAFGRVVKRCVNGVDPIRSSPILLLLFLIARQIFG